MAQLFGITNMSALSAREYLTCFLKSKSYVTHPVKSKPMILNPTKSCRLFSVTVGPQCDVT